MILSFFCHLFSSFGVGSLRLGGGGSACSIGPAIMKASGLCTASQYAVCEGDERERQLQQTRLCFSVQHSVGLLQPRRRAAEEPLIGQRGSHGGRWMERERSGKEAMSCGGWAMIGRVK